VNEYYELYPQVKEAIDDSIRSDNWAVQDAVATFRNKNMPSS